MKKVAVIGAGIVGSTAAYYLSKNPDIQVTVYDHGKGQATKASAGIISPWFSKRRNKAWYRMARLGADFYQTLIHDLENDGFSSDFYFQTGVYLLKKDETKLNELFEIASNRREESPIIGELKFVKREEEADKFGQLANFEEAIFASGGAKISGAALTKTLLAASKADLVQKKVTLDKNQRAWVIDGKEYDEVILAVGACLPEIIAPYFEAVDVRPQKGQLMDLTIDKATTELPVIMPEGELDIIPLTDQVVSIGASHENDKGFDLTVDEGLLAEMKAEASKIWGELETAEIKGYRVGTRAYTSDFSPFFGPVPQQDHLYVASGLGSSGLTTGPIIGYELAQLVKGDETLLNWEDYSPDRYLK